MFKTSMMTAVLAAGTVLSACAAGTGVLNVDMALQASPKYQPMVQQMQKVEQQYAPQLNAMEADLNQMKTQQEQQQAMQGKYKALIQSYMQDREKATEALQKDLNKATQEVLRDQKLDIILAQPVQIAAKAKDEKIVDVTPEVAAKLQK